MAFLRREYLVLVPFLLLIAMFLLLAPGLGWRTSVAYLAGGFCSILAGLAGMQSATHANVRTSEAARAHGQAAALRVAFGGGAVMGLSVASLGLVGIGAILLWLLGTMVDAQGIVEARIREDHLRLRDGGQLDRALRARRRRHLHQGRGRRRRPRRQGRGRHPRGRSAQPGDDRRQRRRQRR
jgi:hypothetical protein